MQIRACFEYLCEVENDASKNIRVLGLVFGGVRRVRSACVIIFSHRFAHHLACSLLSSSPVLCCVWPFFFIDLCLVLGVMVRFMAKFLGSSLGSMATISKSNGKRQIKGGWNRQATYICKAMRGDWLRLMVCCVCAVPVLLMRVQMWRRGNRTGRRGGSGGIARRARGGGG